MTADSVRVLAWIGEGLKPITDYDRNYLQSGPIESRNLYRAYDTPLVSAKDAICLNEAAAKIAESYAESYADSPQEMVPYVCLQIANKIRGIK